MREKTRILWLSAPAALLAFGTVAVAEPQIGNVIQKEFKGATGARAATAAVEELVYTHDVFAGEKVSTPAGGSTVMRFRDQTQLQIGANSSVVLDRFVYDPSTQADSGSIKLAKGIFRYIGGQATDAGGVQLSTPTATLAIRGTKFIVHVKDDGTTTVAVLDGAVDVKPCGTGDVAHAKTGQAYQVTTSCTANPVPMSSMPVDPATTDDFSVSSDSGDSNGANGNPSSPDRGTSSSVSGGHGKGNGPGKGGGIP
jgi:ferric-dicitrate binding protein FerR (iron transport regulator)